MFTESHQHGVARARWRGMTSKKPQRTCSRYKRGSMPCTCGVGASRVSHDVCDEDCREYLCETDRAAPLWIVTQSMLRTSNTPVVFMRGSEQQGELNVPLYQPERVHQPNRDTSGQTRGMDVPILRALVLGGANGAERISNPTCFPVSRNLFKRTNSRGGLVGGFARRNTIC